VSNFFNAQVVSIAKQASEVISISRAYIAGGLIPQGAPIHEINACGGTWRQPQGVITFLRIVFGVPAAVRR
jgi:hypothetical protein